MKFDKIIVLCIVLLTLMTISSVGACENSTLNDDSSINENAINAIDDGETLQTGDESISTNDSSSTQTNEDLKEDSGGENDTNTNHQDLIKFTFKNDVYKDEYLHVFFECKNKTVTGNLSVYIDGDFIQTFDVNDDMLLYYDLDKITPRLTFDSTGYAIGNHTLNVIYSGNDYYDSFNETFEFNIGHVLIDFDEKMILGDYIQVKLPYNATGIVTIRINETKKQYNLKNIKSSDGFKIIQYELKNLKYDTYAVEVNYNGNYGNITKKGDITIDYDFFFYTSCYGDLIEYSKAYDFVYFIGPHKNITLLIDGVKVPYDLTHNKEGSISRNENEFDGMVFDAAPIWFSDFSLSQGYHTIELKYPGDKTLPAKSIKATFYVKKAHFAEKSKILVNSKNTIKFIFPKNTKGNFSLYISQDNKKFKLLKTVNIKNNVAKVEVSYSKVGTYYIKAVYNTGKGTKEVKTTYKVVPAILKYDKWYERQIGLNSNGKDTFKLETGKKVTGTFSVYINEKLYKSVKIKSGNAKITVPFSAYNKKEGGYTLKCVWKTNYGNGKESTPIMYVYDASDIYFAYEPYNKNTKQYSNNNIFYGDKFTYSLQIIGKNAKSVGKNKVVTFKVGKHTFKVKTDKKGVATLKLSDKVLPGTYTITATYNGKKYQNLFYENGKEIPQKLRVKEVLELNTVKVKKSAKEIVLKATLENKDPMNGKTVTFKFAGKTYKAKTNSDGIAKVTIKQSVLKNLKVGKYVTYSATFLKDTVEETVKIQK